ncbi:MAG: molecular chaperone HtpG [Planctomycetota bacterium]
MSATKNSQPETLRFQAEVQELLGLMIHSLYKHREIFLRELVSNASDAIDKRHFESLTHEELKGDGGSIRIELDRDARTLSIEDDGIGMTRDELTQNLGTIARSGTREFLARARAAHVAQPAPAGQTTQPPALIGQFGVGFYSSFMVAERVVVDTRRAGGDEAWRWTSDGGGEYTLEPGLREQHGTRVTLHLRPHDPESGDPDFLSEWTIRDVVKRYSDFVAYPIQLETGAGEEQKLETLNSMKPLWTRPKDDVQRAEHDEFYRHLTHDPEPPLDVIHFKAEGTNEYTALLYIPAERPFDLFEGAAKSRIALYVKRVLILPDSPDLLPAWMRFVRGVVDSSDLPLNVSREVLQASGTVRQIQKRLVKRVLESLTQMLESDRERYRRFWNAFGVLMKEGMYVGDDPEQRIRKIALFDTTWTAEGKENEPSTLDEYVARMKPDQEAIYTLAGTDRKALEASPHLEPLRARGFEVLLLTEPVDEFVVERVREFDKKPIQAIDRGDLDLASSAAKEVRENLERDHREFLAALEEALGEDIANVRYSTRLADSPAVLVNEAGKLSANMERILRAARQDVPHGKRVLELNPEHGAVKRLLALHAEKPRSDEFREAAELVHGQALLAEGSPLADPARFAQLLARWLGQPRSA